MSLASQRRYTGASRPTESDESKAWATRAQVFSDLVSDIVAHGGIWWSHYE